MGFYLDNAIPQLNVYYITGVKNSLSFKHFP